MLALRAIPFSFAILWRYIVVLPILIIALVMLAIMGFIFMLIAALISPIFTIMIWIALSVGATVVPVMVGMRLGLQAKEVRPKNTYFGVMIYAIGYGLFESFCVLLIIGIGIGLYLVASPLTLDSLSLLARMDEGQVFDQLYATSPMLTIGAIVVTGLITLGLRAALLTPFAGASIGADPTGRLHTPFYAFGSSFFSMLVLTVVSLIGWVLAIPLAVLICAALGFGESLSVAMVGIDVNSPGNLMDLLGVEIAVFTALCFFFYMWFFSIVCAGGVLSYHKLYLVAQRTRDERDQQLAAQLETDEPPMDNDVDMMDLLRSRMPDKKY